MAASYRILNKTGNGYYEEKRSRFLATAYPVHSEEEAALLIAAERKKTYDARHHCWAYALGPQNETCRFSDDGEPSGTAGKPILEVLLGREIHDVLIIVTRYFGGTLLGTGGLVRAYTAASQDALAHAETAVVRPAVKASVTCGYSDLARIDKLIRNDETVYEASRSYGEKTEISLYLTADPETFASALGDASSGRAVLSLSDETGIMTDGEHFLREHDPRP